MADDTKRAAGNEKSGEVVDAGDRHIGRTLEQEGIFSNVSGTELPPVAETNVRPGGENVDSVEIRRMGENRAEQSDAVSAEAGSGSADAGAAASDISDADSDSALENFPGTLRSRPEALKTRLPGDTSSDPHTDVGPDNATTAQGRTDEAA